MSNYRVVLENAPRYISCHRIVRCEKAETAEAAAEAVRARAEEKNPKGWRVIAVTEASAKSRENGYYTHANCHLALLG